MITIQTLLTIDYVAYSMDYLVRNENQFMNAAMILEYKWPIESL